jgi:adenine-specific DNA-methyltransferase
MSKRTDDLLARLNGYNAQQLRRLLMEHLTERKLGLRWESDAIERDRALNANVVFPRLIAELSCPPANAATSNAVPRHPVHPIPACRAVQALAGAGGL